MKKQIWKYVLVLAATGGVAVAGSKISQLAVDAMKAADSFPKVDAATADAHAKIILQQKCADCHGPEADYNRFLNLLSFGLLRDHVENARRTFTMESDGSLRSGVVDYLKMDRVLTTRHMPPAAYTAVHIGSRLTLRDVAVLRNRYSVEGAAARRFAAIAPQSEPSNEWESARIYLGWLLYNDGRLSTTNEVSCASCHDLTKGGTDNLAKSEGVPGPDGKPQLGGVNAPTTYNAAGHIRQFWDGRAADLQEQAGGPPLNPVEMGYSHPSDWEKIAAKLQQDPVLVALFAYVYGDKGITGETITGAIAAYEKTLVTPDSAFDRYLRGEDKALTDEQKEGMEEFVKLGCATCHAGPALGGISFEYINTHADFRTLAVAEDYKEGAHGLADYTGKKEHADMFRVPTLRNVALTAPYFHTGSVDSLHKAVRIMMQTQTSEAPTDRTVENITSFLESQTGQFKGKSLETLTPQDVRPNL